MQLKSLEIEGYKSIGKISIVEPNPFTVFVGPNASGKSNIFEALEFLTLCDAIHPNNAIQLFGNFEDICNQVINSNNPTIRFEINFGRLTSVFSVLFESKNGIVTLNQMGFNGFGRHFENILQQQNPNYKPVVDLSINEDYIHFFNFTRLFIGQPSRLKKIDDSRIRTYDYKSSNLEKVLKRILKDENKREEIFEILQLLIPGFERVEIVSSELSGTDTLIVYEESLKKPLTKELISDGTYNILSIIAALYQSDTPQFLCIEEPENGLNPFVVKELVNIIRDICEEKGHYIWLNTHSSSIVSVLTQKEIIIVDKVDGLTQIKQIQNMDLHGLRMDDALYTNSIGGGNPW